MRSYKAVLEMSLTEEEETRRQAEAEAAYDEKLAEVEDRLALAEKEAADAEATARLAEEEIEKEIPKKVEEEAGSGTRPREGTTTTTGG